MNGKVPKIVPKVKHFEQTPIISWIRDILIRVKRDPLKAPPGPATPDGKAVYRPHTRFPDGQASRSTEPALAQGGVSHRIADNYYYERDARRMVTPPTPLFKVDTQGQMELKKPTGEPIPVEQFKEVASINFGPEVNYGFNPKIPTPGFGYEWVRNVAEEEETQQRDRELAKIQKFDKFMKPRTKAA